MKEPVATLSVKCMCGRTLSVACPEFGDIGKAHQTFIDQGWRDYEQGTFCSDACSIEADNYFAVKQQRACEWPPASSPRRAAPAQGVLL